MKILSCNIRDARAPDGVNGWSHRRSICIDVLRRHAADIFCFQEMRSVQFDDIGAAFPDYDSYGLPEDAQCAERPNAIFYRRDRFNLISAGGYWLSETPALAGSKSWHSAYVRLLNWLELQERATQKKFRLLNTHLDDASQLARERQAQMIVAEAAAWRADEPQILTADINGDADNPAFKYFTDAAWRDSLVLCAANKTVDAGTGTYHAFQGANYRAASGAGNREKIDWILVRGAVEVIAAEVVRDNINDRYPSDHYFLSAVIDL